MTSHASAAAKATETSLRPILTARGINHFPPDVARARMNRLRGEVMASRPEFARNFHIGITLIVTSVVTTFLWLLVAAGRVGPVVWLLGGAVGVGGFVVASIWATRWHDGLSWSHSLYEEYSQTHSLPPEAAAMADDLLALECGTVYVLSLGPHHILAIDHGGETVHVTSWKEPVADVA